MTRTLFLSMLRLSGRPMLDGNCISTVCSSNGRVMTKIIRSTNARSNSGVMLISFNVTSELRWEKRRISLLSEVLSLHLGNEFLREIVQFDRPDAQAVDQIVVSKHRRDRD